MKMKKTSIYWLSLLLCTLALGFTSCEKDDEEDEPVKFGSEKYESISGLYEVEDTDSGIESIELTAGGEYIIVFAGHDVSYSSVKNRTQRKSLFELNRVVTRNVNENYITGTYTYDEDSSEIILEGYGSLLVYSLNSDGTFDAFVLSTDDGDRIELDVTKREELPNSEMTQKLCRTWKPKREEIIFGVSSEELGIKNQTVLEAEYSFSTGKITVSEVMTAFAELKEMLEEMFTTSLRKVVFSKAGTYMVYHEYDGYEEVDKANWRWNDEKAGYLLYYWDDEQDYEYSDEGVAQISFVNNTLCVSESVELEEYGTSMVVTLKTILVEAN